MKYNFNFFGFSILLPLASAYYLSLSSRANPEWRELEYVERLLRAEMSKFCWSGFAPFTLNENARDSKVFAVSFTFGR
jgi:hypothetical protein